MTYKGKIKNGVVVLDDEVTLAEGTVVKVEPMPLADPETPGIYARLLDLAGRAKGLPPDLAENHDHYVHGRPRS